VIQLPPGPSPTQADSASCRTHRERKEIYIKALEEQVMQLKETYTGAVQEKIAVTDENRKLKELLRSHGIPYNGQDSSTAAGLPASYGGSSSGSRSGSYPFTQGFSPPHPDEEPPISTRDAINATAAQFSGPPRPFQQPQNHQGGMDHDQLGVDFVLASVPPSATPRYPTAQ
jgi:hypothetical protein